MPKRLLPRAIRKRLDRSSSNKTDRRLSLPNGSSSKPDETPPSQPTSPTLPFVSALSFSKSSTSTNANANASSGDIEPSEMAIEPHRVWHDPVIEVYGNIVTPAGRGCSIQTYDVANRRWYRLDLDCTVMGDDWISKLVEKHIRAYYNRTRSIPPWNTIRTTSRGSPVVYKAQPESAVAHILSHPFNYGDQPTDRFRAVPFSEIREKQYLSRGTDKCRWDGRPCVFKRIEFDADVPIIERAIRIRETLLSHLETDPASDIASGDLFNEMERRFHVVPVLAVVIRDEATTGPWAPGSVAGILMPNAGESLDHLADKGPLPVTEAQLRELVHGVQELNKIGVMHGDICDWNVTIQTPLGGVGAYSRGRLALIDLGNVAEEYDGDAKMLGRLFSWVLAHSSTLTGDAKKRLDEAGKILRDEGNLDLAIEALTPS